VLYDDQRRHLWMKVKRKSGGLDKYRDLSHEARIHQEIRTDNTTPPAGFTLAGITDQTNITVVNELFSSGCGYIASHVSCPGRFDFVR